MLARATAATKRTSCAGTGAPERKGQQRRKERAPLRRSAAVLSLAPAADASNLRPTLAALQASPYDAGRRRDRARLDTHRRTPHRCSRRGPRVRGDPPDRARQRARRRGPRCQFGPAAHRPSRTVHQARGPIAIGLRVDRHGRGEPAMQRKHGVSEHVTCLPPSASAAPDSQ